MNERGTKGSKRAKSKWKKYHLQDFKKMKKKLNERGRDLKCP